MGLLGDFSKGFVIMTLALWIFAIIVNTALRQIGIALLLLFVLTIPLTVIALEYRKYRKKEKT